MSDREHENEYDDAIDGLDASELTLEAILAEFRSTAGTEPEAEPSSASPLILEPDEGNMATASIRSVDELLFPESLAGDETAEDILAEEELQALEDELEDEDAEEAESLSETEEPAEERGPDADPMPPRPVDIQTQGYEEDEGDYVYAGTEVPEPDVPPEPIPIRGAAPRGSALEGLFTRLAALLALASMNRRRQKPAPPPEPEAEAVPEMPAARAAKLYTAQRRPLRLRAWGAFGVSLILVYISLGYSVGLPLAGAMASLRAAALFCLIAELCVMLLGLDVLAHGFSALLRRQPNGESLIVVSCFATLLDTVLTVAVGDGGRGFPFCAVSALSLSFSLLGGQLYCRGYRCAFRALSLGRNPNAVTAEYGPAEKEALLYKTRRSLAGFIRRSEEPDDCEEKIAAAAPFFLLLTLVLTVLATFVRGRPGDFFHVLAALSSVCAPFAVFLGFPLLFSQAARRLLQNGTAIAGWAGTYDIGRGRRIVITDGDIFPPGTMAVDTIRVLEGTSSDKVISYTGSLLSATGSSLAGVFTELMRQNGCSIQRVEEFSVAEGGVKAFVRGEEVLVGTSGFMHLCGIRLPQKLVAKNAVFAAVSGTLMGIFTVRYTALPAVQDALVTLLHGRRSPIFAVRDFNVDPLLIRQKFKVATDSFEFPSFAERYRISAAAPADEIRPAAMLVRDGLTPLVEVVERGLRLYRSTRLCSWLSLLCSLLGLLLLFLLCWNGEYRSASAGNVVSYMLLWLVPLAVMLFDLRN